MFKKIMLPVLVMLFTTQLAQASAVSGFAPALNRALRFQDMTSTLTVALKNNFGDVGYIGNKEIYFSSRPIGPVSSYELDAFTIHLVESGASRSKTTIQINVVVRNAAEAKAQKLKLLIEKALKNVGWSVETTMPYQQGGRRLVGVGPEHISLIDGAQNVKIAKFIEEMASLAERLKTEDLLSVLSR